jgi:RecA-family ATPase
MAYSSRSDNSRPPAPSPNGRPRDRTAGKSGKQSYRTVAELAAAKELPEDFLRAEGLADLDGGGIGIPYFDETGAELFVRRRDVPHARQRFLQPTGVSLVPYGLHRLPDFSSESTLHLTEGETDTLTLWFHHLAALGLPGANTCRALKAQHLSGFKVIYIVPDNDKSGEGFVKGLSEHLARIGYQGKLYALTLPDHVKDVSELHCRGPRVFEKEFLALAGLAARLDLAGRSPGSPGTPERQEAKDREALLVCCQGLEMRPTEWFVPEFIPRGGLSLLAGDGGDGKSAITLHMAAMGSQGRPCFGLDYTAGAPADVILVGCEDAASSTVLPRLAAAGANLARVHLLNGVVQGASEKPFTLGDIDVLEAALQKLCNTALVVIDPVSAFIPPKVDDHRDSDVRGLLRPLADLAARYNLAVVLVKHLNKSDSPMGGNLVAGSRGYINAARAAFLVGADPTDKDETGRCVMVFCKRNLTRRSKGLAYRKESLALSEQDEVLAMRQAHHLGREDRELLAQQLFRVVWLEETEVTDRDLARARRSSGGERQSPRIEEAAQWLSEFLAAGARLSEEVFAEGAKKGFSKDSLYKAKEKIGVNATSKGFRGKWEWSVPSVSTSSTVSTPFTDNSILTFPGKE